MHSVVRSEDDMESIRVLPRGNARFAISETEAIAEHSKRYRAANGVGWTEPYRLEAPPEEPLAELSIPAAQFCDWLSPYARQYASVTVLNESGYTFPSDSGYCHIGFGPSTDAGIFADCEDGKVLSIWCDLPGETPEENAVLADMLLALNSDHDLILVDWDLGAVIPLDNREAVEGYLATYAKLISASRAAPSPTTAAAPPPPDSRRPPPRSAAGAAPAGLSARLLRFLLRRWRRPWGR